MNTHAQIALTDQKGKVHYIYSSVAPVNNEWFKTLNNLPIVTYNLDDILDGCEYIHNKEDCTTDKYKAIIEGNTLFFDLVIE